MKLRLFVVDDDPDYAELLSYQLRKLEGVDITILSTGESAVASLDLEPDLIFLDVVMPGQGGLETLRRIKFLRPTLPVVMVSAQSVVSVALEAIKAGAADYITKGHDDSVKVLSIARNVAERVRLEREIESLRDLLPSGGFEGLIGNSKSMLDLFRLIKKTLRGDLTVAIVGESGTGKELVAQAIHRNSPRNSAPFVVVNCAAIPRELMESEFFGHEKGAFTGAVSRKLGRFEQADSGTIFLDEIGELDLSLQAKLLRVLQNQQVQRVGGNDTIQVDVRVLCATNRDIPAMIDDGTFREDLYYRLFQFPVVVPPLRDRDQDALLLAEHFRSAFVVANKGLEDRPFSGEARRRLLSHDWPGNVRELKNAVERALLISDTSSISADDLLLDNLGIGLSRTRHSSITAGASRSAAPAECQSPVVTPASLITRAATEEDIVSIEDLKALAVEHAYRVCEGNINKTAERLGVTRSTIYRLMKKHDLGENASANVDDRGETLRQTPDSSG
jgi:DNA-binding NtrC family response regulator